MKEKELAYSHLIYPNRNKGAEDCYGSLLHQEEKLSLKETEVADMISPLKQEAVRRIKFTIASPFGCTFIMDI